MMIENKAKKIKNISKINSLMKQINDDHLIQIL